MIAVLAGASGLTGSKLLELLIADERISHVVSVGRRSSGVKSLKLSEIIISDLTELLSVADSLKGDIYYCCLGSTIKAAGSQEAFRAVDYQGVVDFAKVAERNLGRAFVLVSAAGANSKSLIFYNRVKGETENALREMKLGRLVIARPGLLIGDRKEHRAAEALAIAVTRGLRKILPKGLVSRGATDVATMMRILLDAGLQATHAPELISNEKLRRPFTILEANQLS